MSVHDLQACSEDELPIRESFKKDYKLSCPVLDDNEIFNKSLKIWGLESEWNDYLEMSKRIPDLEEYRRKLRNQILSHISHVQGFDNLQPIKYQTQFKDLRNYLKPENCGHSLISIDLQKGNYQAMRYLNPKYVLDTTTYETLVRRFTKEESIIRSKFFRQMVFGQLKPEVQASVQRKMTEEILKVIFSKKEFPIVHLSNDEAILRLDPKTKQEDVDMINKALEDCPYQFRISVFTMKHIENQYNEPWYVRTREDGEQKIMGVHVKYLFQVYNHLHHQSNTPKDFWWRERGRLCALLDPEVFLTQEQTQPQTQEQTQPQTQEQTQEHQTQEHKTQEQTQEPQTQEPQTKT